MPVYSDTVCLRRRYCSISLHPDRNHENLYSDDLHLVVSAYYAKSDRITDFADLRKVPHQNHDNGYISDQPEHAVEQQLTHQRRVGPQQSRPTVRAQPSLIWDLSDFERPTRAQLKILRTGYGASPRGFSSIKRQVAPSCQMVTRDPISALRGRKERHLPWRRKLRQTRQRHTCSPHHAHRPPPDSCTGLRPHLAFRPPEVSCHTQRDLLRLRSAASHDLAQQQIKPAGKDNGRRKG